MIFQNIIQSSLSEKDWRWFIHAMQNIDICFQENTFLENFALVGRYFPSCCTCSQEELNSVSASLPYKIDFSYWKLDEIGRAEMLLALNKHGDLKNFIHRLYRYCDNKEQIAVLKSLALLPSPGQFLPVALDAHRSNVLTVFSALACHNPFPANFMEEFHFNNLVLKAIFVGLSPLNIYELQKRLNPNLSRIVEDWILEREAANRPIMPEVWGIVVPFATQPILDKVYSYLGSPDPEHRYWSAFSLGKTKDKKHLPYLEKQSWEEKEILVKNVILEAIKNFHQ